MAASWWQSQAVPGVGISLSKIWVGALLKCQVHIQRGVNTYAKQSLAVWGGLRPCCSSEESGSSSKDALRP